MNATQEGKVDYAEASTLPQRGLAACATASLDPPAAPCFGDVLFSKVAFEIEPVFPHRPGMFCKQLNKDPVLRQAMNEFTPFDVHARCCDETANVVHAHSRLVESLAVNKEIAQMEHDRLARKVARLRGELDDVTTRNHILQAEVLAATVAREACESEFAQKAHAHQQEVANLSDAHERELSDLMFVHATELAQQRATMETAAKRKQTASVGQFFRDLAKSNNVNAALKQQLAVVRNESAARITTLQAQVDAAQQATVSPPTQSERPPCPKMQQIRAILQCTFCDSGLVTCVYPKCCLAAVCAECGRKWRDAQPVGMVPLASKEPPSVPGQTEDVMPTQHFDTTENADNTGNHSRPAVWTLAEMCRCPFC
ncbi:hypothetical protein K466DRAFT_570224 [Polyporus arcularius HHB13444]|uniref:Uncharacterized protein n=1 Tax=Polyporus arcularius HHB13444 TaxID=1314778 RepID=A0A5C3NQ49_9APHY|nr:hypothetical protein K466DRAFT_570224 [Polyporus arcularius HHB13444]